VGPAPARTGSARSRKFRQAAFAYLHVGLLYECGVFVLWREGLMPVTRGPAPLWLAFGALITGAVVFGLWRWQNVWFARIIWVLHALRLPAVLRGAFFADAAAVLPASLYLVALAIILINLWLLARAGWDL
jgi:hypothetical protein